jgi:phosphate/sulfate permease
MEISLILVVVLIIMGIFLAYSIGANDETLSALVGANVTKFKIALIIGGIAAGIGMILFSEKVGETVGQNILGEGIIYTNFMLLSVLISSIIWLIIGSFIGMPLSSTHSTVGSIIGVLIVYSLFQGDIDPTTALNYDKLNDVILSWFLSPLFGFLFTFILFKIISKLFLSRLKGLNQIEKSERNFKWILLIAVIFAEIWVGANSAECIGIFVMLRGNGSINLTQFGILVIICGVFVFLGIFSAGRYVIKTLASQMTDARPSEGFIIQISSAIILMISTLWGLPVSHSHVIVFCILGLNAGQKREIDYKGLGKMAIFWVLTFFVAAILAGIIYLGFISVSLI